MPYYVYVLQCRTGGFYTGYTKNLDQRMRLHINGKGARYTRMHKPLKLAYVERFGSRREAMRKERKIKGLNHRQKMEMINSESRI